MENIRQKISVYKEMIANTSFVQVFVKFGKVSRLDKPLPILMLYLPCIWGIFFGYNKHIPVAAMIYAAFMFLIGAIAGRSFGCIINDIIDKDIDEMVERTKDRPIASGAVSVKYATICAIIWLIIGFLVFIKINYVAKFFVIIGLILSIIYPFTKRFLPVPQFFLGAAFNIGILVGYSAIYAKISNEVFLLYIIGIYITVFYDTIYAMQDVEYDEKMGLKSAAIKYKGKEVIFLFKTIIMIAFGMIVLGIMAQFNFIYYLFGMIIVYFMIHILKSLKYRNFQLLFYKNIYVLMLICLQILPQRVYG